jgi:hypothetical protein
MTIDLHGTIKKGHGVASGASSSSPYPHSSIAMQAPFFRARGLDLAGLHPGTLNVSIAPARFAIAQPDFIFKGVAWTNLHPPETFSFVACDVVFGGASCSGWLYHPHPETKAAHWQDATVMEVIAPRIDGVQYGAEIVLRFADGSLTITAG